MVEPKVRFPEFQDGWKEKPINELAEIIDGDRGNNYPKQSDFMSEGYCVFLNAKNVTPEGLKFHENMFISKDKDNELRKGKMHREDVVITSRGTVGNIGYYSKDIPFNNIRINSGMLIIRAKEIVPLYLYMQMRAIYFRKQLEIITSGNAQPQLTVASFSQLVIRFSSKCEQDKIADFLSKVDERISVQQSIISDLEDQKKGLMQKLFSQEIRFKADDGNDYPDWDVHEFNEVFSMLQNNTFSRVCLNQDEGEALNIHYGDVLIKYDSFVDIDVERVPFINSDISLDKFNKESYLLDGDVIIADTAEDDTVGKVVEIFNSRERKILSGLHTIPCRPKKRFASKYLGYYLNSFHYHNQIIHLIQGIKVSSISKSNIADTKLLAPCLEEQERIVGCLMTFDKKVKLEKAILEDWQQIKKGLLQQMFV